MQQMRFQAPPLSKTNKFVLIIVTILFVLNSVSGQFFSFSISGFLSLRAGSVLSGNVLQLITYPLMEVTFFGALFNCLLFWFIGGDLETRWGEKFYRKFIVLITLLTAVLFVVISLVAQKGSPLSGLTGINYAFLIAYAIIHKDRELNFMFIFPLKTKYFCMLIIGIELYSSVFSQNPLAAVGHLLSMGIGFGYLKYRSASASTGKVMKKKKSKAKLRIVKNEEHDKKDPKYWQ